MKKITLLLGLLLAAHGWAQDCTALTYYSENFESVTTPSLPACAVTSGANTWTTANNPGNGFENNTLKYTGNAQAADAWFFSKGIAMTAGTWYKITYRYGNNSATTSENLTVTIGTGANSSDAVFQTHTGITGGTPNTYVIDLYPAQGTGTYYIGFHAASAASQGNLYVDDIIVEPTTCHTPTGLKAFNVLSTSATISWDATANNNNNSFSVYHYAYMPTNTPPAGPPDLKYSPSTSVSVTDLLPSTTYYLFVRTQCGPVNGDWSEGVPFTTPACNAAAIPYIQDFESSTVPAIPACTSVSAIDTGNQWSTANNPGNGFENNALQYAGSNEPANAWFFTQGIPLVAGNSYKLSYKFGNNNTSTTENLKVTMGYSPNPASVITTFNDQAVTGGAATTFATTNAITITETGIYYFGFNAHSASEQGNLYVDDIVVEAWTCSEPANIAASNITITGATITWEAQGNPAVGYLYAYNTTNETPSDQNFTPGLTTALANLEPGTTYYFFIKGICGPVMGDWSESITFTTPACEVATIPYSLDFESTFVPSIPGCTLAPEAFSGNNWVTANNVSTEFFSNTLVYTGTNDAANAWFYTQGIELTAGTFYKVSYKYGNNSATTTENLRVTLNSNPNAAYIIGNNFATHEGITGGTQLENSVEYFNVPASGVYYFGFNAYSAAGQGSIYVDDFLIEAIDCGEPVSLTATDVTDTTATISWLAAITGNASPSVYQYHVSTTNTPPTESEFIEASTVDLTDLEPNTTYYVFVRVQCGPTWSGWETISFTTTTVAGTPDNTFIGIMVYPNPVKDVLMLDAATTIGKIEVYSITGQLVHTETVNSQNAAINLHQLSAGAYLLNIMGDSQSKRVKIIKQ